MHITLCKYGAPCDKFNINVFELKGREFVLKSEFTLACERVINVIATDYHLYICSRNPDCLYQYNIGHSSVELVRTLHIKDIVTLHSFGRYIYTNTATGRLLAINYKYLDVVASLSLYGNLIHEYANNGKVLAALSINSIFIIKHVVNKMEVVKVISLEDLKIITLNLVCIDENTFIFNGFSKEDNSLYIQNGEEVKKIISKTNKQRYIFSDTEIAISNINGTKINVYNINDMSAVKLVIDIKLGHVTEIYFINSNYIAYVVKIHTKNYYYMYSRNTRESANILKSDDFTVDKIQLYSMILHK